MIFYHEDPFIMDIPGFPGESMKKLSKDKKSCKGENPKLANKAHKAILKKLSHEGKKRRGK